MHLSSQSSLPEPRFAFNRARPSRPRRPGRVRRFGRGRPRVIQQAPPSVKRVNEDLKLFATTFLAGFLFVSLLIA